MLILKIYLIGFCLTTLFSILAVKDGIKRDCSYLKEFDAKEWFECYMISSLIWFITIPHFIYSMATGKLDD